MYRRSARSHQDCSTFSSFFLQFFFRLSSWAVHRSGLNPMLCPCLLIDRTEKPSTMPDSPADVKAQSRLTPPTMPPPPGTQGAPRTSSFTPTTRKHLTHTTNYHRSGTIHALYGKNTKQLLRQRRSNLCDLSSATLSAPLTHSSK